jgi:hypothetical protein
MIDESSFLGLFTLELIGQAFFRSAGKGIRISLPASPVNQAHVAPPPKSPASGCRISHAVSFGSERSEFGQRNVYKFADAESDCFDNGLTRNYAEADSVGITVCGRSTGSACTFRTTCEG